jgi:beta-carotene ketolase (CrtO type)
MPDAIIIGGGHNGLTCAAYLARAGLHPLVLEQRSIVGGYGTTEETIQVAPGFRFSPTSLDMATGNIPPSVVEELDLARHGLRWVWPDPFYSYISPEGHSIAFWRDHGRTCKEIAAFSRRDAERYAALTEILADLWHVIAPYMMAHPTRPGIRTVCRILAEACRRRSNVSRAVRILLSAPGPVLDEWFESRELKAALACFAIGGVVPLDEPLSGLIMSVMALQHQWGVRRPVGGMGAFTAALAADVTARGGAVRTGVAVAELIVSDGKVVGVITAAGEQIHAANVVGSIDPITLFRRLLPAENLPPAIDAELRGLGMHRNNFSAMRIDVALDQRPRLILDRGRAEELLPSTMLFAPDIEYVRSTTAGISAGMIGHEFPLWAAVPSVIDRSLVPQNSHGEGMYIFVPAVPYRLQGQASWDLQRERVSRDAVAIIERYAPGMGADIIGTTVRSPADIGHAFHCDMSAAQMGPWRPTPSLAGYGSPVGGLWHTGAGAHPFGTICGWPGRTAAATLIRTLA